MPLKTRCLHRLQLILLQPLWTFLQFLPTRNIYKILFIRHWTFSNFPREEQLELQLWLHSSTNKNIADKKWLRNQGLKERGVAAPYIAILYQHFVPSWSWFDVRHRAQPYTKWIPKIFSEGKYRRRQQPVAEMRGSLPACQGHYFYFGGARSKGFATLRNVSKLQFFDKIGHAKSVDFRLYSAIWRSESRISSRYMRSLRFLWFIL